MSNTYKEHLTLNKWNLWAHLPHDTDWSIHSYKKIFSSFVVIPMYSRMTERVS